MMQAVGRPPTALSPLVTSSNVSPWHPQKPSGSGSIRMAASVPAFRAAAATFAAAALARQRKRQWRQESLHGPRSRAGLAAAPVALTKEVAVGGAATIALLIKSKDVRCLPRLFWDENQSVTPRLRILFSAALIFGYERAIAALLPAVGLDMLPSTLVGMLSLFGVLRLTQVAMGTNASNKLADIFNPGADFLGKWMGLFLAPPLASLDKSVAALPAYSQKVWVRTVALLGLGWAASASVAAVVAGLLLPDSEAEAKGATATQKEVPPRALPPVPMWSAANLSNEETLRRAWVVVGSTAYVAAMLTSKFAPGWLKPFGMLCELSTVVFAFTHAKLLPKFVTKVLHPIVLAALAMNLSGRVVGSFGVGALLFKLLNAAVTGLGVRMYYASPLWLDNPGNFRTILASCSVTGLFSVVATALAALAKSSPLRIPSPLGLPIINRSVMSALGLAGAATIGPECDPKLAVASILITGCIGASFGRTLLRSLRFKENSPVVRGTAMGCSAHSIGAASLLADGQDEAAAIAGASMCLAGTVHTAALQTPSLLAWIRSLAGL